MAYTFRKCLYLGLQVAELPTVIFMLYLADLLYPVDINHDRFSIHLAFFFGLPFFCGLGESQLGWWH